MPHRHAMVQGHMCDTGISHGSRSAWSLGRRGGSRGSDVLVRRGASSSPPSRSVSRVAERRRKLGCQTALTEMGGNGSVVAGACDSEWQNDRGCAVSAMGAAFQRIKRQGVLQ